MTAAGPVTARVAPGAASRVAPGAGVLSTPGFRASAVTGSVSAVAGTAPAVAGSSPAARVRAAALAKLADIKVRSVARMALIVGKPTALGDVSFHPFWP